MIVTKSTLLAQVAADMDAARTGCVVALMDSSACHIKSGGPIALRFIMSEKVQLSFGLVNSLLGDHYNFIILGVN